MKRKSIYRKLIPHAYEKRSVKKVLGKNTILQLITIILTLTLPIYPVTAQEGNQGYAIVSPTHSYSTDGDYVQNIELTWQRYWMIYLENRRDGTGQPLVNPNITIVTDIAFTGFTGSAWNQFFEDFSPNETAPPVYIWYWERNLEENEAINIMGNLEGAPQIAPGFSLSRRVIPSTISRQTTLQLVKVTINLNTSFPIDANYFWVMISYPDTEQVDANYVKAFPRPREFYGQACYWRKRPIMGKTYTFFLLLKIDKLVVEQVQYKPRVQAGLGEIIDSERVEGNTMTLFHPEDVTAIFSTENYVEWEGYTARYIMVALNLVSTTT